MSPEQAANYISHSVDLVYDMIRGGKIPFIKKGTGTKRTQYVVDRLDLDKWIESKKESNAASLGSPDGIRTRSLDLERVTS